MSEKKMTLYEKLKAPFPKDAYSIDKSRGFDLTTIDAYHIVERLNNIFGLCGTGWRLDVKNWIKTEKEITVIAELWYDLNTEKPKFIPCEGGKRIIKDNITDAYKSARTNAISKGASFLGIGLDVYKGEFDNGKTKSKPPKEKPASLPASIDPSIKQMDMIEKILKSHLLLEFEHYRLTKSINKGLRKETASNYIEWWIGDKSERKKRGDMEKLDKKNNTNTLREYQGKKENEIAAKFPQDYKEFLEIITKKGD